MSSSPDFLDLPQRTAKPRACGITHVIDRGLGPHGIGDLLALATPLIDIVKLGWGTAYVSQGLPEKIRLYQAAGIPVYFGGSLFEVVLSQNKVSQYAQWLQSLGIDTLEISNGMSLLMAREKLQWIRDLSREFTVFSEVGSKDPSITYPPENWADWFERELEAGATYVIAEGRESGTAGIYETDGALREPIIDAIVNRVPVEKVIFEAPNRPQQMRFIQRFGSNVNIGNVSPDQVINLETLRLGLRADTFSVVYTEQEKVNSPVCPKQ